MLLYFMTYYVILSFSFVTAHNLSLRSSVTVETRLASVYNMHVPR